MEPDLAFEKARDVIDVLRDKANRKLFSTVPKFAVVKGNTIDLEATDNVTMNAWKDGKISDKQYEIEIDRLDLLRENRNKKEIKTNE